MIHSSSQGTADTECRDLYHLLAPIPTLSQGNYSIKKLFSCLEFVIVGLNGSFGLRLELKLSLLATTPRRHHCSYSSSSAYIFRRYMLRLQKSPRGAATVN
jgi:hypothetical protein